MIKETFPILVVEDDPNDVLLLKRAFQRCGITEGIHVVNDGEQAILYLRGEGKYSDRVLYPSPRCIVTDLKMPRKGGLEVLDYLKAHPEQAVIPTIVLTSSKDSRDIREAYGLGANSYLVKPSNFTELEQMVMLIYNYWRSCEKPSMQGS